MGRLLYGKRKTAEGLPVRYGKEGAVVTDGCGLSFLSGQRTPAGRPRLTTRAGFEIGSGISINPSLPEEDAAVLKAALE